MRDATYWMNILEELPIECDWASLRYVKDEIRTIDMRNKIIEQLSTESNRGVMIQVIVDGSMAYTATSDCSKDGITTAARRCCMVARQIKDYQLLRYNPSQQPITSGSFRTKVSHHWEDMPLRQKVALLKDLSGELSVDPLIGLTTTSLWGIATSQIIVSTNGTRVEQKIDIVSIDLAATAFRGSESQTRTFGGLRGNSFQGGLEVLDRYRLNEEARRIGRDAVQLLDAEQCPIGNYDVLLYPDQMMLQIHESIGHALEIDRILGDERNYAGTSFVRLEDFGSLRYGSPLLNITFDPTVEGEMASYGWDDEALPARKEYLIKDGLLINGLGGLTSQVRSGLKGVANTRASSWNRPPIDRMANLNCEPGTSSLDELLSSIDRGIIMKSNKSWSIDDYREKFQFGCEWAQLVEKGKPTAILKNPNYRGITIPFWQKLKALGDRSTFSIHGTPFCGKGEPSQSIRVGHASPIALFSDVSVFGGAR